MENEEMEAVIIETFNNYIKDGCEFAENSPEWYYYTTFCVGWNTCVYLWNKEFGNDFSDSLDEFISVFNDIKNTPINELMYDMIRLDRIRERYELFMRYCVLTFEDEGPLCIPEEHFDDLYSKKVAGCGNYLYGMKSREDNDNPLVKSAAMH